MRHNFSGRKLNRTASHRKMLQRNLVTALFEHERIQTTVIKAKETRSLAERLITFAKRGDLHARRLAARKVNDPQILRKLFDEIGPRFTERRGGYTRILKLSGTRLGDGAELAILELVDSTVRPKSLDTKKRQRARRILKAEEKAEAVAALQEAAAEKDGAAEEPADGEADIEEPK
ncbi:MAG: 50S ribosomal protein L17 [Candidatus Krumholzibacteria bacterium]|nr:50S ribosomal protein L17 [Candidatus Krumholzibacteria bacterium]MDY0108555.1 50S ribosomal protein L17 [Candidatus Krumholzibacteria bacterium]